MVVIAVVLAAFLDLLLRGIVSTSLAQMQRNQVVDTYEAVHWARRKTTLKTLKGLPELSA